MNDSLWNFAVRKPLWWFLRRFLSFEEAQEVIAPIEALVAAALAKKAVRGAAPLAAKGVKN